MCDLRVRCGGAAAAGSDEYIAGHAAATLEHEFHLSGAVIEVDRGAVTVQVKRLGGEDPAKIVRALEQIPGVVRADVQAGKEPVPSSGAPQRGR